MTPRPNARTRRAAAILALALVGLGGLAGCDPRMMMYFLQPWEPTVPAPGPKLEDKKVVLVTNAVSGAGDGVMALDHELSREVSSILKEKVETIKLVDSDKVQDWIGDHKNWTDPAEVARAFEADVVIILEVEGFQLQHPGDLNVLQGTARTHIQVTEMVYPKNSKGKPNKDQPKEPKQVYDEYQETEFPARGPIPIDTGISRSAFKNKFLKVVAAEISWHFVDHSPDDNIQDVRAFNR